MTSKSRGNNAVQLTDTIEFDKIDQQHVFSIMIATFNKYNLMKVIVMIAVGHIILF